ncbi:MAG: hypothetical protein COB02_07445 [Candidatus Cloacimonadota bacterium]|nr:MAG: hypothetical protein COB02_07445 [Candidatus Cloacimonadota bacterium]
MITSKYVLKKYIPKTLKLFAFGYKKNLFYLFIIWFLFQSSEIEIYIDANLKFILSFIFLLSFIDISIYKLNEFHHKALLLTILYLIIARFYQHLAFKIVIIHSDLILILFCLFRSLHLIFSFISLLVFEKEDKLQNLSGIIIILFMVLLSIPKRRHGCRSTYKRKCFTNLKAVLGALEMYELDTGIQLQLNNKEDYANLVNQNYMRYPYTCRVQKQNKTPYYITKNRDVCCKIHGCVQ